MKSHGMSEWAILESRNPLKSVENVLESQFVCMIIGLRKMVNSEHSPRFGDFGRALLSYCMILQNNDLEWIVGNLML